MHMDGPKPKPATNAAASPPLNACKPLRRTPFNRLFAALYLSALAAFFYHHALNLYTSDATFLSLLLLIADLILAFEWAAALSFRLRPVRRQEFPENLEKGGFDPPAVDIFICTADPYKEPPMGVVNTALSVMAYDYPPEKVSVYISDDGGSQLTLFAFMEGARFAGHWLPFCRANNIQVRSPGAYFKGNYTTSSQTDSIKALYEEMKTRVEDAIEKGKVGIEHIHGDQDREMFSQWTSDFHQHKHPTVIQVLLDKSESKDKQGHATPNLIYVSREKSTSHHHKYKAGALNTLIRVSAAMTNAPIILTLDCDMYSNDPQTIWRALCYFMDPRTRPALAYVQFPQIFYGLNKNDIYGSEQTRQYQINILGLDGLRGPNYFGSNCFFQRRAFFGGPSRPLDPNPPELCPTHVVEKPIRSPHILILGCRVAAANYEHGTLWGSKMGVRYGSLVEDFFTGYQQHCEGWRSIYCNPERPAFLGDSPVTLVDMLGQPKRWAIGLLEVLFCRFNPLTYGARFMGLFMGLGYSHNTFWPLWSIPLTIYAFIPQLALLNSISIFPKVSDPWFALYLFLFVGANGQDLSEFLLTKSTFRRWWNSQRVWMMCGLSPFLFGCVEFFLSRLGVAIHDFTVTSKVQEEELNKRYNQGRFEFGVSSPMFLPLAMAAVVNLAALVAGAVWISEGLVLQVLICGFGVVNCWPVYEAMVLREDRGRLPLKTTMVALFLVLAFCVMGGVLLRIM